MLIRTLTLGPLETNCYIVAEDAGKNGVVIDPVDSVNRILDTAKQSEIAIARILLTHGHFDHILALRALKDATGASVAVHPADEDMLKNPQANMADMMGLTFQPCPPDEYLDPGSFIAADGLEFKVLATPGHTPGGISLYVAGEQDRPGAVFTGDALFAGSIGRSDLPGSDAELLLRSIRENLLTLPGETRVYPGHGPASTIGREKAGNPFLI